MNMNLTKYEIDDLIDRLQNGETIPDDFKYKLFPVKQKEYELVYGGKMRKEDILANEDGVSPVPLQVEKIYNGHREQWKDWRNIIAFGDNLQFLKTIYENKEPLIKNQVKGKVKLIYIDPPFATESDFKSKGGDKAYTDKIKGAEFVEFLRRRLIVAREILSDDGNIIVHLDNKKIHYAKIVLDEVFGEGNYINEIVWHKGREGGSSRSHSPSSSMPTEYQNILIYSKIRKERFWNPILGPYKESTIKNIQRDEIGWYYTRGRMGRTPAEWELEAGVGLKSYVLKEPNKTKEEVIKQITSVGAEFVAAGDVWNNEMIKFSQITDYPTEKPEDLLKLFIKAATKEGDIVLDFFGGSGTTAAVAEKLNRKWITCDIGKLALYTIQKRLLNIESSKSIGNPKKEYGKKAKSFISINTGHYDLAKIFELKQQEYSDFVMNLFEVDAKLKTISGIQIDGEKKDGYNVIIWQYWKFKDSTVDEDFLHNLHSHIGTKAGKRVYIIAPANYVDFISDYYEIEKVRYYFLKVPYHIIQELHKVEFKKFRQPQSKSNVNDLEDAIGFHFMRQPEVKSELKEIDGDYHITIKKFLSDFSEEETQRDMENFESLSMVLIDKDFSGNEFDMDAYYFAEDLLPKKKKKHDDEEENENIKEELKHINQISLPIIPKDECGERMMIIYVDIYGNEFKEELKLK
ncbi:MAG: site-specific DNA-methyltransferase [Candidatus Methanoperedenaceae archaeon]|nr:site-specific DNA-methyltransferase [Candidatus Methanoperedenaceae archaeon]